MNDFEEWEKDITIYHKNGKIYNRYQQKAFIKNTTTQIKTNNGISSNDNANIRIFNVKEYNKTFYIEKGDIIVNKAIEDNIIEAPITELSKKYGRDNVYQVKSIKINKYNDRDMKDMEHIKIEAI